MATDSPGTDTCDSCGATGEALAEVRRVYVTPESWDTEGKAEPAGETERWCAVCLTHYPHQPVEP